MDEHRWKVWQSYLKAGRVRYRTGEFRCRDVECQRWHVVHGPASYAHYQERNQTLEDLVLNALLTSATHGCKHPRKAPKKTPASDKAVEGVAPEEESTNGDPGLEAADTHAERDHMVE